MVRTILAIILATTLVSRAAEKPPATQNAPSRYAAIELKIDSSLVPLPPDKTVQRLNKRAAELAKPMLDLPAENISDWLQLNWTSHSSGINEMTITVNLADLPARPAAAAFADAMVDTLREYQKQLYDQKVNETIPVAEQRLVELTAANSDAQRRITDLREKVRELSGRSDYSAVNDAVNKLEEELTRLQLDVLAKTARREAIEKQIAEQSEMVARKIDGDAIAVELQKVVEAREAQVQRVKELVTQKSASVAEVNEAIGRVAEARAKLLERKRDAAAEAGGDAMSMLNKELLTLSVDLRELNARLEFCEKRVPNLRKAQDLVDEFNRARRAASESQNEMDRLAKSLASWRQDLAQPPEISITSREVREKGRDTRGAEVEPPSSSH